MPNLESVPNPPTNYRYALGHPMRVRDMRDLLARVDAKDDVDMENFIIVNSGSGNYTLRRPY